MTWKQRRIDIKTAKRAALAKGDQMDTMDLRSEHEFAAGEVARAFGKTLADNPNDETRLRASWAEGWKIQDVMQLKYTSVRAKEGK